MTLTPVHVRWMIRRDMKEVLDIEQQSFEFAWNEEQFLDALRTRNTIGMVAEHNEQVVGFMIYELKKGELELINFAVAPWVRRSGVGTTMVDKLKAKLAQQQRTLITTHVREGNLNAQMFFKAMGFHATEVIHGFYEDSNEDAYLMRYEFGRKKTFQRFHPKNRISDFIGDE